MPTIEEIRAMSPKELASANARLARSIAAKIVVGLVVTAGAALIVSAVEHKLGWNQN